VNSEISRVPPAAALALAPVSPPRGSRPRGGRWGFPLGYRQQRQHRRLMATIIGPVTSRVMGRCLLRRVLALAVVPVMLSACTRYGAPTDQSQTLTARSYSRVDVYEAMIRYLARPKPTPIWVQSDLCFQLIPPAEGCPDHLSHAEQEQLAARLRDLGKIEFKPRDEPLPSPSSPTALEQLILLSPIVQKSDGLRVEGGAVCGSLCGSGAVYIVVPSGTGYEVKGKDESYPQWVS
jgi:hypothetical protein